MILLIIGLVNNSWALPWFHPGNEFIERAGPPLDLQNNSTNFSGVWTGQCDNNPALDLTIKQNHNHLSISYGFMEERYVLGENKSAAMSGLDTLENSNAMASWNTDHSGLIFINYQLFINATEKLNVFFSKVSMTLQDEQLLVNGHYLHADNTTLGDFKQEKIACVYHRR